MIVEDKINDKILNQIFEHKLSLINDETNIYYKFNNKYFKIYEKFNFVLCLNNNNLVFVIFDDNDVYYDYFNAIIDNDKFYCKFYIYNFAFEISYNNYKFEYNEKKNSSFQKNYRYTPTKDDTNYIINSKIILLLIYKVIITELITNHNNHSFIKLLKYIKYFNCANLSHNDKKKLIKVIIELKNIFGNNEDIDNPKDMAIAALIGGNFGGDYCCKFGYKEKDIDIIHNFYDAFYKSKIFPNIDDFSFCRCGCEINGQCIHIVNSARILKYILTDFNYNLIDFVYGYDYWGNFDKLKVSIFNELINKDLSNLNYSYSPNNDNKIINDLNILLYALSQKEIIDNINDLSFDMIFDKYKNVDINKFFNDFKYINFINDLNVNNDPVSFSAEPDGLKMNYTSKDINLDNIIIDYVDNNDNDDDNDNNDDDYDFEDNDDNNNNDDDYDFEDNDDNNNNDDDYDFEDNDNDKDNDKDNNDEDNNDKYNNI